MKKYIAPSVEIQDVELVQLIADSIPHTGEYGGEAITTKEDNDWNIWSDDEE